MIGVIATLRIKDGQANEFESVLRRPANAARQNEEGNLCFQLTRSRRCRRGWHQRRSC
jgi:quinol monooxygenase YgiN